MKFSIEGQYLCYSLCLYLFSSLCPCLCPGCIFHICIHGMVLFIPPGMNGSIPVGMEWTISFWPEWNDYTVLWNTHFFKLFNPQHKIHTDWSTLKIYSVLAATAGQEANLSLCVSVCLYPNCVFKDVWIFRSVCTFTPWQLGWKNWFQIKGWGAAKTVIISCML